MMQITPHKPALLLAPMEGIVEGPMRAFFAERGGFTYCVGEFLRISQDVPPLRTFLQHLPELSYGGKTPSGTPVQLQLLGGDPEKLARAAILAYQAGSSAVDLNFGCPAPVVNRHDGGAALLKYPDRIYNIVKTVREALPVHVPLSVKLRLGWDNPEAVLLNSDMAAQGGASWITIHGRTRMQGYQPPAYWKPIGEVRKRVGIPVVANGEIWTLEDFERCREETGCEHFMLGRGALADPRLPHQVARAMGLPAPEENLQPLSWHRLFQRFTEIANLHTQKEGYVPARLKQWSRMIHNRFPTSWFDHIKYMSTSGEILNYLETNRC